ncbi:MAG: Hpt domain-containing protein [Burkholderiales bacterium]
MLLRLSRLSFWLAAAVAAFALLAPGGHETLLAAVASAACLLALALLRMALRTEAPEPIAPVTAAPAPVLGDATLLDVAARLVRGANAAGSFEAALHAVAQLLRSELGARRVAVLGVHAVGASHAEISDLIESQPGFKAVPRRVRLDATPLAQTLRTGTEAADLPGSAALAVLGGGRVVAAVELGGIDLPIEARALTRLLELARLTLSQIAAGPPQADEPAETACLPTCGRGAQNLHGTVLVIEDNIVQPEVGARMLRRVGCRVVVASGMLDGLNLLRKTQFSLILIDAQMLGADATGGVKRLRAEAGGARDSVSVNDVPVIALSGRGLPGDGERFRELGFDDHLSTPFRQSEMLAMLSKHLRSPDPTESKDTAAPGSVEAAGRQAAADEPVLDPVALARLGELDPTGETRLLERVLRAFQTSVARLHPQLDAARGSDDRAAIRLVAHTLKSSSASIGAMRLSQLCAEIENAIRLETQEDLSRPLGAFDAALDRVLLAIDALLKERA